MVEIREAISDWAEEAKKHAGWLVVLGVVTIIAGVLAIGAPMLSGFGVSMMIGFALLVGGVARTVSAFSAGSFGQGTLAFIGGILTFVAGVVLVFRPGVGVASLTLALGIYLLVGWSRCQSSFQLRGDRRIRIQVRRKCGHRLRFSRHNLALARFRSRAVDVLSQRV